MRNYLLISLDYVIFFLELLVHEFDLLLHTLDLGEFRSKLRMKPLILLFHLNISVFEIIFLCLQGLTSLCELFSHVFR